MLDSFTLAEDLADSLAILDSLANIGCIGHHRPTIGCHFTIGWQLLPADI
jgi:hypothetical protein